MSNLIKLKKLLFDYQKVIKIISVIICLPFGLIILELLLNSIFNLGIYTGTFFRFLYDIVVY